MKTITFLFSAIAYSPIGGYKVVYEYANRLVKDGFEVNIIYAVYTERHDVSWIFNLLRIVKSVFRFIRSKVFGYKVSWFDLDSRVKESVVFTLNQRLKDNSDIYIATSLLTAVQLNKWECNNDKGYIIQGFENWGGISDDMVYQTYQYPFKKIVISNWLRKIVSKYDPECVMIPNGFDYESFRNDVDYEKRDKYCLTMMYHTQELKGCQDGFRALEIVKAKYPQIKVNLFGVFKRPKDLPSWYSYYRQPDRKTLNQIYNEASIFIGTSWSEGWGLTIGEAMICGCAIACTDNDGYKEMAIDRYTALLSPIKSPQLLADNIIRLLEDDNLRSDLAKRGNEYIKAFNWEKSYTAFKRVMC